MSPTSLYVHIPFCLQRCGYCDFNTYAGLQELIPAYSQAICREIEYLSAFVPERLQVHTIYFGGGTPSLVPAPQLRQIISTISQYCDLSSSAEITLEANPGTVSASYLSQVHEVGVNRLSLGMQSAHQAELSLLERQHSFDDVIRVVSWARQAGIENINLDLIFGLPGQRLDTWLTSLAAALSMQPEHVSLYALSLEHGTPLKHQVDSGILPEPDADLAADMYEAARERLAGAEFTHYEISNWARKNEAGEQFACKHNLQYWKTLPYLGIGAGAHGFINHYRTENVAAPKGYITSLEKFSPNSTSGRPFPHTPATLQMKKNSKDTEIGEFMMMGLRLVEEGVSNAEFQLRYGERVEEIFSAQISRLIGYGLLEWSGAGNERIRLTQKGQLLGNQVFCEFI